jgi:23S rRNA pseudouridine2605 synthase
VIAPQTHLDKTYHVQIATVATEGLLQSLRAGVVTGSGERLRVKSAHALRGGEKNSWLEMVLDEGKNRHIRKLMEHLGIEVLRVVRVAIGPLVLGNLAKGQTRPLTNAEKGRVDAALQQSSTRIDQPKKISRLGA